MQFFSQLVSHKKLSGLGFALGIALLAAGCRLGQPAEASFASVQIKGKTPVQICQATAAVFMEDGYQVARLQPQDMVFQKQASQGTSLAYSGVSDTYYGNLTVVRVKAQVVSLTEGNCRLQCKAYMVRDAGDSFFEDESALLNIRSRPYQSLLSKVADRLK